MIADDSLAFDACSELGARRLAQQIVTYWQNKDFWGIQTWVEKTKLPWIARRVNSGTAAPQIYAVRSNSGHDGYPPLVS